MIDFVICDDDQKITQKVSALITRMMIDSNQSYKINCYNDYDNQFIKMVSKKGLKVYILDIVTPSKSGIDIAKMIRKNDLESIIIFLTGHEEMGTIILKKELYFLSFINKYDDFEKKLINAINNALKLLMIKKVIQFKDGGIVFTITLDNIIYIMKENNGRYLIIKTDNTEYKVRKTLLEIKPKLNNNFIQTHRACFVNINRVEAYDKTKKEICFDNGIKIDLLSNNGLRALNEYYK